ncbi:MAG: SUMF1/EgtB/PvdO family nonheme iron enzyme [Nitrospira sp.]|nr:SUMF1/EgtB/PvdO family nonheme iron enzyme [Nitrospira sp.]
MSKIFISHSSSDNAKALAVAQWLEQNGWADYFLDITPSRGLSPGERWQEALKVAADRCEAVVFLISPAWRDSKWCLAEFLLAKQLGKTIFGVVVEPTPIETLPREMTAEWQLCDLASGSERQTFQVFRDQIVPQTQVSLAGAGLVKLKQGLQKAGLDPSFFPWPPPNDLERLPYRGLKALEAEDAAVFFGREAPLILALDTLRRMVESGEQLLVILGASGAGKSSFLRAGLWPRLKRDDRHFLPLPVVRPERAAISGQTGLLESLEKTFREYKTPKTRADLRETLAKPDGLVELLVEVQTLAQKRLGPGAAPPTIVIGIDQAEELFVKEGGDEAGQLLESIGGLIGKANREPPSAVGPSPRVMVLSAIRSDSYERLQAAPVLAGIRQTPFNLPPLAPAEYKMVIEGPAVRATSAGRKLTIEPALTAQLLQDAEGADALPLLAFILERLLIDYGADGDLLLKEYEALGGLQGSIEAAVKEIWKNPGREPVIPLDEATRRALLHQAFPALVMLDHEADKPKRRVATWDGLPQKTHPLLERLVEARLLLKDRRKLADGQEAVVVEVTHEALIRHWSQLKNWVDANREFLAWQQRLNATRKRWEESRQHPGLLLHGLLLREAENWLKKRPDSFSSDERTFITAGQNRKTKERLAAAILAGLMVLLIGGTNWLWQKGYNLDQAVLKIKSVFVNISIEPEMRIVPSGTFLTRNKHLLEVSNTPVDIKQFGIARYEVTFEEYDRYVIAEGKSLPGDQGWGRGRRPVINVSYVDAETYARWLSITTHKKYRLPTSLEWEYAASNGKSDEILIGLAVFADNSHNRTSAVGQKIPNDFGLYDMLGNVWEWSQECSNSTTHRSIVDPLELTKEGGSCTFRMLHGGSWGESSHDVKPYAYTWDNPANRSSGVGFRLVQDLEP